MAAMTIINNTLASIANVLDGGNGTTNLTDAAKNETEYELLPILRPDIFYEVSFFSHLIGGLYVLFKTVSQRKCEGFSYKAQLLLTLASLLRFTHVDEFKEMVLFVPKISQLFVDVAAFVAVCIFKTQKKSKSEPFRVELLILGCFFLSQMKLDTPFGDIAVTMSLMLNTVALLPQFIIVEKTKYLTKLALWFIHCHLMSQIMYSFHAYKIYCFGYGIYKYEMLCREMLSRLCILLIGMIIFMNYMKSMLKGYENLIKTEMDVFEANNGHDEDCPQKDYPVLLAVSQKFYNQNKTVQEEDESK